MPTDPLLDLDALLAEIPGDNPAGGDVPFEDKDKLEELRKEDDPSDWAADDPTRPTEFKKADWAGTVELTREILTSKSKDMLTAARLCEGLVRLHGPRGEGFAALRDGLRLQRRLLEECWDRLWPAESEGLKPRARGFFWLDTPDRGILFPNTVRNVHLLFGRGNKGFSWQDAQEKSEEAREAYEKAYNEAEQERCRTIAEDIAESLGELTALQRVLQEKLGSEAAGMSYLREALESCDRLAKQILREKWPEEVTNGDTPAGDQETASGDGAAPAAARGTREDAYRQLAEASNLLKRLEPHSPIPYFIDRAVHLGRLRFPDLLRALVRDANVLNELSREMGLGEGGAAEAPPPAE
jgi:type VI secretion system protein ImpA